ncbi:ankyrin repeat domain-containing protein, partial [Parashewanella curva]
GVGVGLATGGVGGAVMALGYCVVFSKSGQLIQFMEKKATNLLPESVRETKTVQYTSSTVSTVAQGALIAATSPSSMVAGTAKAVAGMIGGRLTATGSDMVMDELGVAKDSTIRHISNGAFGFVGGYAASQATESAINYVAKSIPVETATSTGSSDKPDVVTDNNSDASYDAPEMASSINITSPPQDAGLNASDVDSLIDKLQQSVDRPPIQANEPVESLYAAGSKQQITSRRLMSVAEDYREETLGDSPAEATLTHARVKKSCVDCLEMQASDSRVWYLPWSIHDFRTCDNPNTFFEACPDSRYTYPRNYYAKVVNSNCDIVIRGRRQGANCGLLFAYNAWANNDDKTTGTCCGGGNGIAITYACASESIEASLTSNFTNNPCRPPDSVAYRCKATESYNLTDSPQSVSFISTSHTAAQAKSGINNAIYAPSRHIVMSNGGYRRVSFGALRDRLVAQGKTGVNCASGLPQQQAINTDFISYYDLLQALNDPDTPLSPRICPNPSDMPSSLYGGAVLLTDIANKFATVSNPVQFTNASIVVSGNQYTNWQHMEAQLNAVSYNGEKLYATNGCVSAANRWRGLSMSVLQAAFNGASKVTGISSSDCSLRIEEPNLTPVNDTISLMAIAESYTTQSPYYGQVGVRLVSTEYVQHGNAYLRRSHLRQSLSSSKRCSKLPAQQSHINDAYKAITQGDLANAFQNYCDFLNDIRTKVLNLPFHFPIRATLLSTVTSHQDYPYLELEHTGPFILLSHNGKVVYLENLLTSIRTLYPQANSYCGASSSSPLNLASVSQSALLEAFAATPNAPQQCSNSVSLRRFGNVVSLQSVADTFNHSPSVKLEPTDIVYSTESHDGVTWRNLTAHFTNNTLTYNSCVDDEFAFRNVSADELIQAHASAPVATPVELGDCSQGVEVVTENDILPLADAVADATRGFGNNGVTGGAQQINVEGTNVSWADIAKQLPVEKQCKTLPENSTVNAHTTFKNLTKSEVEAAAAEHLNLLCDEDTAFVAEEESQLGVPIESIPTQANARALATVDESTLFSDGTSKAVNLSQFTKTLNQLFPNAICLGELEGSAQLQRLTQADLQQAFNATPPAPIAQECADAVPPKRYGTVITAEEIENQISQNRTIKLNGTDLVFDDEYVTWESIVEKLPEDYFKEHGCINDEHTWRQLSLEVFQDAYDAANATANVTLDDCSARIDSFMAQMSPTSISEVASAFNRYPDFGNAGLSLGQDLQIRLNDSVIQIKDILPFFPEEKRCLLLPQAAASDTQYNSFKAITDEELTSAILEYIRSVTRAPTVDNPTNDNSIVRVIGGVVGTVVGVTLISIPIALLIYFVKRQMQAQGLTLKKTEEGLDEACKITEDAIQKGSEGITGVMQQAARDLNVKSNAQYYVANNSPQHDASKIQSSAVVSFRELEQRSLAEDRTFTVKAEVPSANSTKPPLPSAAPPVSPSPKPLKLQTLPVVNELSEELALRLKSACIEGDLARLKQISPNNFNVNQLLPHHLTGDKVSLLHLACASGQTHIVHYLIEQGADVNLSSALSMTPLYLATLQRKTEVIKQLLKANVDISIQSQSQTPLELAKAQKDDETIRLLQGRQPKTAKKSSKRF